MELGIGKTDVAFQRALTLSGLVVARLALAPVALPDGPGHPFSSLLFSYLLALETLCAQTGRLAHRPGRALPELHIRATGGDMANLCLSSWSL